MRQHLQVAHRRTGDGQQLTKYRPRNVQELRRQGSSDWDLLGSLAAGGGLGAGGLRHGWASGGSIVLKDDVPAEMATVGN